MSFINKLLPYNEMMEWVNSPQAEGRIGSEDRVTDIYREMLKENRDRKPGDDWAPSVFIRLEEDN